MTETFRVRLRRPSISCMKTLLVNSDDGNGGAARAAMRLHLGLRSLNIESYLLVQKKNTDTDNIIGPRPMLGFWRGEIRPHLDALPVCRYPKRTGALFSPAALPGNSLKAIFELSPDILHLHWICNGMIRLESLRKIKIPIVWTLHDSWAFSGGCHLPGDCLRYQQECGSCPVLGSSRVADLSRKVWERKRKVFADINLTIVTPSRWLAKCVNKSSLLSDKRTKVIPNGLDTKRFKPLGKHAARNLLGLPQDVNLVLFSGSQAAVDENKGASLLLEALKDQPAGVNSCFELVVLGASADLGFDAAGIKTHYLGRLNDEVSIALVYSSVDLLVLPSREENLPYTVMEAMSCGLPCVAFDVGGISDLIEHMSNGYLVSPHDVRDFGLGIKSLLNENSVLNTMSTMARRKIVKEFDQKEISKRYLDLYSGLL